jgi:hypothetical protein
MMPMKLSKYGDFGDMMLLAGGSSDPHSLGYIYVIGFEEPGVVKIGSAQSPLIRLSELQCGNPFELKLHYAVSIYEGSPILIEFATHRLAAERKIRGEWFDMTAEEALEVVIKSARNAKAKFGAFIDAHNRQLELHAESITAYHDERRQALRAKLGMDA